MFVWRSTFLRLSTLFRRINSSLRSNYFSVTFLTKQHSKILSWNKRWIRITNWLWVKETPENWPKKSFRRSFSRSSGRFGSFQRSLRDVQRAISTGENVVTDHSFATQCDQNGHQNDQFILRENLLFGRREEATIRFAGRRRIHRGKSKSFVSWIRSFNGEVLGHSRRCDRSEYQSRARLRSIARTGRRLHDARTDERLSSAYRILFESSQWGGESDALPAEEIQRRFRNGSSKLWRRWRRVESIFASF